MIKEDTKKSKKGRKQKGLYKSFGKSEISNTSFEYEGNFMVYGLACTEYPDLIKYVGFTSQKSNLRYNGHSSNAKKNQTPKDKWILELNEKGHKFILVKIEDGIKDQSSAIELEKIYIRLLKILDPELLNRTAGGIGITGFQHTDETKKKMSDANMGKPFKKGAPLTEHRRAQLRLYSRNRRIRERDQRLIVNRPV